MNRLSIGRFGLALGTASAFIYLGCVIVMLILPRGTVVAFFNTLMHGIDVEPLMRWDMPWWEACLGVLQTFILAWFFGTFVASIYNVAGTQERSR